MTVTRTRTALVALALISAAFGAAPASAATTDECIFVAEIGGFRCPSDLLPTSLSGPVEGQTISQGEGGNDPAAPVLQPSSSDGTEPS
jgi:hypothetical protein